MKLYVLVVAIVFLVAMILRLVLPEKTSDE